MKRFFGLIFVTALITLAFSVNSMAAGGNVKIGFFDVNAAAAQSQWGKKIIDDLKREQEKLGGDLEVKKKAFLAAKEDYDKKKDVMDEKARTRKQKELQDLAADMEKMANESTNKFNTQANEAKAPLFKKLQEIVNRIARDEKYDFIFEKTAVLFGNEKDDLTKRIASELDKSSR